MYRIYDIHDIELFEIIVNLMENWGRTSSSPYNHGIIYVQGSTLWK